MIILGFILGVSTSYLGTGSALFLIPLLPLFIEEISPSQVVATSLLVNFLLMLIHCVSYRGKSLILWTSFFRLSSSAIFTATIVASIVVTVDERIFRFGLAGMLVLVLLKPQLKLKKTKTKECILGLLWGGLNGASGLGGTLISIIYFKLNWMDKKNIVPTVNALMCVLAFVMLCAMQISYFYSKGLSLDLFFLKEAGLLLLGSLPGGIIGRRLNLNLKKEILREVLLKILVFCLLLKVLFEFV